LLRQTFTVTGLSSVLDVVSVAERGAGATDASLYVLGQDASSPTTVLRKYRFLGMSEVIYGALPMQDGLTLASLSVVTMPREASVPTRGLWVTGESSTVARRCTFPGAELEPECGAESWSAGSERPPGITRMVESDGHVLALMGTSLFAIVADAVPFTLRRGLSPIRADATGQFLLRGYSGVVYAANDGPGNVGAAVCPLVEVGVEDKLQIGCEGELGFAFEQDGIQRPIVRGTMVGERFFGLAELAGGTRALVRSNVTTLAELKTGGPGARLLESVAIEPRPASLLEVLGVGEHLVVLGESGASVCAPSPGGAGVSMLCTPAPLEVDRTTPSRLLPVLDANGDALPDAFAMEYTIAEDSSTFGVQFYEIVPGG
jgi:hypothetical protein